MTPDDDLVAQCINKKKKFFFITLNSPRLGIRVNVLMFQENLFSVLDTHHVDYVMKRKAKDNRQGLGEIFSWSYTGVVPIEQILRQSVFVFIPKTCKTKHARNLSNIHGN